MINQYQHAGRKRHSFYKQSTRNNQYAYTPKNRHILSLQPTTHKSTPKTHHKKPHKPDHQGQKLSGIFQTASSSFKAVQSSLQLKAHVLKIKRVRQNGHITRIMRIIVIDWLMKVGDEFKISKQTLHNTIYCLDRLVSKIHIKKQQYQVYALTSLIINQKYSSKVIITVQQATSLLEGTVTQQEILDKEQQTLLLLDFKLNPCTLWIEINILLRGVQLYFMAMLRLKQWVIVKNRMLWIIEGIVMQRMYDSNELNERQICLALIHLVLRDEYALQASLYELFCAQILKAESFGVQILHKQILKVKWWLKRRCCCQQGDLSCECYHPQLKQLSAQYIYS